MHVHEPDAISQLRIIGRHQTAVTGTAEVFRGEETEATEQADVAHPSSATSRTYGLRRIFNHRNSGTSLAHDGFHISRKPEQVHRQNGARAVRDGHCELPWIEVVGQRVDIDKHRFGVQTRNAPGARNESERRSDDLMSSLD